MYSSGEKFAIAVLIVVVALSVIGAAVAGYYAIQAENERHAWCVNLDNTDDPRYGYLCDDDSMGVE